MILGAAAACLGAQTAPGRQPGVSAPPAVASPADAAPGAQPRAGDATTGATTGAPTGPTARPTSENAAPSGTPEATGPTTAAPRSVPAAAEGPPLSHEGLARLADAPREQQQAWLRELKRRLDRALSATLSAKKAAQRQAEIDAALRRPTVDWDTLRSLLDELERREAVAINTLERRCRVAIFNHFRLDTRQSDARHEALDRVLDQWRRSGKTPSDRDALITWLEAALSSCSSGDATPMPAEPPLAPTAQPAPIEPPPASGAASPRSSSEHRPIGPVDEALAGFEPFAARAEPTVEAEPLLPRRPIGEDAPEPDDPRSAEEDEVPSAAAAATEGPRRAPAERAIGRSGDKGTERSAVDGEEQTRPAGSMPRTEVELPAPPWQPSPGAIEPPRAEIAREKIDDTVGEVIGRAAARGVARRETDAAAQLAAAVSPLRSRPAPLPTDIVPDLDAPRQPATPPLVTPEPAPPPADVNLADLAARIAGANLELRALEAELIDERLWDVDRLERAVGRLEQLVARQRDLARYGELVPPARRTTVPAVESPRFVVSRLGRRVHQARGHAAGTAFTGSADQRHDVLERLDALSRRLAGLVAPDEPPPDESDDSSSHR